MEGKSRILVVEDTISWQENYQAAFDAAGYSVVVAEDLPTALAALDRQFFHVAVVDLKLSEDEHNREGLEVLRRIWALNETLTIVGTGYADASMFAEFTKIGIFGFTEIPTEARRQLDQIDFYKGHITKTQPLTDIVDKVSRAMAEALPKSIYQRESTSPFRIFRGIPARQIQQALGVAPMTELHPFLASLVRPIFPWLLPKSNISPIKYDQSGGVLAIETLCWSRALGTGVVVRFGRRDQFEQGLKALPIGADYSKVQVSEKDLVHKVSDHFEGRIRQVESINFNHYFDPPPVKRDSNAKLSAV